MLLLSYSVSLLLGLCVAVAEKQANILFIVADDLGYNDLSSYGSPTISTPNIDRIGANGAKFTQFYQGAPLCTPARASMLTGRLPVRSGIYTDLPPPIDELSRVFYPTSEGCLPDSEITIAEALKPHYATGMIGKWHLGHNQERNCLPGDGNQGFDFFYGIPYSHEEGYPGPFPESLVFPPVPLMSSGYHFVEQPFNGSDLTARYTSVAVDFIERFGEGQQSKPEDASEENLDFSKPFFLHIGYENPHVPLFIGDDYDGTSRRGFYGNVVQEMDLSIGRMLDALDAVGLTESTMVVFTSDNGAWVNPNNGLNEDRATKGVGAFDGGCNAPFYEGKGSTWEGGFRVPLVLQYPGTVPAHQIIRAPVTAMDLFPTFLAFAGHVPMPHDRVMDGVNLESILMSADDATEDPHECIYLWRESTLYAIRCGSYKAHFITRSGFEFGDVGTLHDPPILYNVEYDPSESIPLNTSSVKYAMIAKELSGKAELHLSSMVMLPSEYRGQNFTVAPCCNRDNGDISAEVTSLFANGPWKDCMCSRVVV